MPEELTPSNSQIFEWVPDVLKQQFQLREGDLHSDAPLVDGLDSINLEEPDARCAFLDYARGVPRESAAKIVVSDNLAFGGVNTSLVFRCWSG